MLSLVKNITYTVLTGFLYWSFIPINYVDKELRPIVKEVGKEVSAHCRPKQYYNPDRKSIRLDDLKSPIIGLCEVTNMHYNIKVDRTYWLESSEDDRYELMAHELAHCLLFKEHVDNPENYMYYKTSHLGKEVVREQFIEDLEEHCGRE